MSSSTFESTINYCLRVAVFPVIYLVQRLSYVGCNIYVSTSSHCEVSQWPSVSRLALAELGDAEISMLYWHSTLPILYAVTVVAREDEQAQRFSGGSVEASRTPLIDH